MDARLEHWQAYVPAVFVAIWSTGFVAARLGMPHAPAASFLALRFALSAVCFGLWALLGRATWPSGRAQWAHLAVVGGLVHGVYLLSSWSAVKLGLGAGTMALIAGMQPLLTALWFSLSSADAAERLGPRQWLGLLLGAAGVLVVVSSKLGAGEASAANILLGLLGLCGITAGSIYQRRFLAPCDTRSAMGIQLAAACLLSLPLLPFETQSMQWHGDLVAAMLWSVLVLTLGGSSLLFIMLKHGAATRVSSLMFLTPPCAALIAHFWFGESLAWAVVLGMGLSALGVRLVMR